MLVATALIKFKRRKVCTVQKEYNRTGQTFPVSFSSLYKLNMKKIP